MRQVRYLSLGACVLFAGCTFTVDGVAIDAGGGDLTGVIFDLTGAEQPIPDLAGIDLAGVDLAGARDFSTPMDFTVPPDFTTAAADMTPPVVPTHIAPGDLTLSNTDVTVQTSIDTDSFMVDGAPAPAGTMFFAENGLSVFAVGSLTVPMGKTVRVTGNVPLVIAAGRGITITGTLDGSAHGVVPGAGGFTGGNGSAPGAVGKHNGMMGALCDSGGSGAAYGGKGGNSGSASGCAGANGVMAAGVGGPNTVGDNVLTALVGGSGGGAGSPGGCDTTQFPNAVGGAGGGAIQLSSALSITVTGAINTAGGGGQGGCKDTGQIDSGSGGGGGSGGAILLEAPTLTISGTLAANGGAGGGGAYLTAGGAGGDGPTSGGAATAGAGGNNGAGMEVTTDRGGTGGNSGNGGNSANDNMCGNSGGGGGGTGRIYIRSRGAANTAGSTISPTQHAVTNL
jgi:hypothetical protein